jgi:hypothetical protein
MTPSVEHRRTARQLKLLPWPVQKMARGGEHLEISLPSGGDRRVRPCNSSSRLPPCIQAPTFVSVPSPRLMNSRSLDNKDRKGTEPNSYQMDQGIARLVHSFLSIHSYTTNTLARQLVDRNASRNLLFIRIIQPLMSLIYFHVPTTDS